MRLLSLLTIFILSSVALAQDVVGDLSVRDLTVRGTLTGSSISANSVPASGVTAGTLPSNVAVQDGSIAAFTASKLTGALPAISGTALTGVAKLTANTFTAGQTVQGNLIASYLKGTSTFTGFDNISGAAGPHIDFTFTGSPAGVSPVFRYGTGVATTGSFHSYWYDGTGAAPNFAMRLDHKARGLAVYGRIATGTTNPPTAGTSLQAQDATFTGAVSGASFSGSGASLTALNGTNIATGTVADARLSANVPMKNAANTFTATITSLMSGAGLSNNVVLDNPYTVSGAAGLTIQAKEGGDVTFKGDNGATTLGQFRARPTFLTLSSGMANNTYLGLYSSGAVLLSGNSRIDLMPYGVLRIRLTNASTEITGPISVSGASTLKAITANAEGTDNHIFQQGAAEKMRITSTGVDVTGVHETDAIKIPAGADSGTATILAGTNSITVTPATTPIAGSVVAVSYSSGDTFAGFTYGYVAVPDIIIKTQNNVAYNTNVAWRIIR